MSETRGVLAPETADEAREQFEAVGPAAQTVTKELAREMAFSKEEYEERVTSEVVETARDALFASLLEVEVGEYAEFAAARTDHPDAEVVQHGSEDVDRAVWHYVPFADALVAATFQSEPEAAAGTLRRIAFGEYYSEVV
jgi:DNA-binding ferritin-like protein